MEISDNQILRIAREAIEQKIVDTFAGGYNSPLQKVINECIDGHSAELRELVNGTLGQMFASKEFKAVVQKEFIHKVAKTIVGKLEGTVEKAVDKLKNEPTLKARMVLAIENIVNESTT